MRFMIISNNARSDDDAGFFVTCVIRELKSRLLKRSIYVMPLDNIRHDGIGHPISRKTRKIGRVVLIILM